MKILFTGGGTGGHFYPVIAITEAIRDRALARKILQPKLYYMAPEPFNRKALFDNELQYVSVPAGKIRRYFSLLNISDVFKTIYGCIIAIIKIFVIYPDVVFGKGGYASFPPLLAARMWRIPVMIHESDSHPGRVNLWAAKFSEKIGISYPDAAEYFVKKDKKSQNKIALTGNPIRKDILYTLTNGAHEFLKLEQGIPTVLILGGSQGAQNINDIIVETLPELLNRYQIVHQVGKANIEEITATTNLILKDHPYKSRYHAFDFLNELALRMSAGVADVIVSRAGSTIFEIAVWGKPSIIIPIDESISHDQTSNAYAYTKTGAGSLIEENNLTSHVLIGEIDRIIGNKTINQTMSERAKAWGRMDSANVIADAILDIALEHEK